MGTHRCAIALTKGRNPESDISCVAAGSTIDEVTRLRHIVETQKLVNTVSLDLDQLMRVVVERAEAITSAHGAVVELVEGEDMVYRAVSGLSTASIGLRLRVATSLSGRCVRLGVPVRCVDTEYDTRVDRIACRDLGIRSMVVVPLISEEAAVGVLKVVSTEPDHFDESDVEVLQEMAGFIAESLQHAASHGQNVYNALHDSLTGLANRQLLAECLEQACLKSDRDGMPVAVFLIDLDGFKQVNDRYGHAAGDEALRLVARRLAGSVRKGDTLARLGGDEFVLVCEDASESDAYGIIARISAAVRRVAQSSPQFADLAASVGLAWRSGEHRSPDELLAAADASMYRVKKAAREASPTAR